MGVPSRPPFQKEGPATACVIDHQALGWKNCTCLSFAMGMFKSTFGRVNLSGCAVRDGTGDTVGGTTIEQNAALAAKFGVHVEVHTGSNVASPYYVGLNCQAGRGFSLAGNTSVLGKGNVNHNVWVNEVSGGTAGHPTSAYVYDPWSSGPAWWSWSKVIGFAHALHPWGESDPRTLASLGISGVYCGIFPDTEPHHHDPHHYGGVATTPCPDTLKGKAGAPLVAKRIRPGPGTQYAGVSTLQTGQVFVAYQWVNGPIVGGRERWYGDHGGNLWVSAAGITGEGGS